MDIDNWDEEQDKNRKLDKYEINESMDLDDIDDILCKEYENFEYNFENESDIIKNEKKPPKFIRYNIQTKLEIIHKAEILGNRATAKLYHINESSIRKMRKNKSIFEQIKNKKNIKTLNKGVQPEINIDWIKIKDFIDNNRSLGICVNTHSIFLEICKQMEENVNISKEAVYLRIYRFLERENYSLRIGTHIGQMVPPDSIELIKNFISNIRKERAIRYNFEIDKNLIVNMDETAIFFSCPGNKTIQKTGKKTVVIKTTGQEHVRVTILLSISASGKKLKPLVIFKGTKNGKISYQLNNHPLVKKGNLIVKCNFNAWSNQEIIEDYYKEIWNPYISEHLFSQGYALFIMDKATMHTSDYIINLFRNERKKLVFIPSGLTSILQPLDVSCNNLFKSGIRNEYINFTINDKNEKKINRELILEWINKVWYSNEYIKKDNIINTFKACGISNNLNGSEDSLITAFDRAKEHMSSKNEENIEKNDFLELNDNNINEDLNLEMEDLNEEELELDEDY